MAELYMAAIAAGTTGEDYDSALSSFSLEYPKKKPSASSRQSPRRRYYCKYCKKSWPLSHFRNSQQFGAHCSNCSRKPRATGALLDDSPSSPVSDMSPEDEAALDGSPLAMEVPSPDLSDDEDGACEMLCTLKVMPPRQPQQQHQPQPQQSQQQQQAGSVSSLYDQSASPVPSVAQQQSQQQQQPQQPQPPQCVPATPSLSSSPALSASQGGAGPEQHQAAHAAAMAAVTGDPYVIEEAWRSLCLKLDELRAIATTSTRAMQQQPSAAFDAAVCEFLRREQAARSSLRALVSQASVLVSVRAASAAQLPPASALLPMPLSLPVPSNVVVPPSPLPLQQTSALLPQLHQRPASAAAAQFATPLPPFILPQQQQPQQMMLPLPSAAGLAPSPVKFPKPVPALRR